MQRIFLIDTDTASDDAVALIMAWRGRDVRVAAVTTVSGNVPVEQATRNALYTAELCGADTPVYPGASAPLVREPVYAQWFHGRDGLGDRNYPAPRRTAEKVSAIDAIVQTVRANPGLTLVTLGPLTNIALALRKDASIASMIERCVVMGGNTNCVGNVTPAAEFNIYVDPDAAAVVFASGMNIELAGWQLSRAPATLGQRDIDEIRALDTPLAHFTIDCNCRAMEAYRMQTGEVGIALPDPIAMAVALEPSIATRASRHHVAIECRSDITRGMTIVDELNLASAPREFGAWTPSTDWHPTTVCWEIDIARWKRMLYESLAAT